MKTFPVNFVLKGRLAVVVGAGKVGMRKMRSLIDAGAKVLVFAGDNNPCTAEFEGKVLWLAEDFKPELAEHIRGASLAFACCDSHEANSAVARECRKLGIPVNCVDQPDDCDFYCPSVAFDGDLTIAVGTGGLAPALAAKLRRQFADTLPQKMGNFAQAMGELKKNLASLGIEPQVRMAIMKRLAEDEYFELYMKGGENALTQAAEELLNTGKS